LKILKQALASWDATESDLADAASIFMALPPEAFQSTCTATQAVVDALIKIVEAERLQSALAVPTKTEHARVGTARDQTLACVAEFVTSGRATVQLQAAVPILKCLAQHAQVCILLLTNCWENHCWWTATVKISRLPCLHVQGKLSRVIAWLSE